MGRSTIEGGASSRNLVVRIITVMMITVVSLMMLSACGMTFSENHYFQSFSRNRAVTETVDRPTNFFRVKVEGWTAFSTSRYMAGFYDERAVDLFFNEIKPAATDQGVRPFILPNQSEPGTSEVIRPLTPTPERGAFVMILSTNADAIASTIGSFAESRVVADAIANLVNRDSIRDARRSEAELTTERARASALRAELDALYQPLEAETDSARLAEGYTRILSAIARGMGETGNFGSLDDAVAWVERRRRAGVGG